MSDGIKRYRADRNGEMYQIAYIDEELGKDEPDPILRDVWVADADCDALAARLERAVKALRLFLEDPRFDVMVGGNPIAVQKMYEQARAVLKERP
jgi:hypothetical protein